MKKLTQKNIKNQNSFSIAAISLVIGLGVGFYIGQQFTLPATDVDSNFSLQGKIAIKKPKSTLIIQGKVLDDASEYPLSKVYSSCVLDNKSHYTDSEGNYSITNTYDFASKVKIECEFSTPGYKAKTVTLYNNRILKTEEKIIQNVILERQKTVVVVVAGAGIVDSATKTSPLETQTARCYEEIPDKVEGEWMVIGGNGNFNFFQEFIVPKFVPVSIWCETKGSEHYEKNSVQVVKNEVFIGDYTHALRTSNELYIDPKGDLTSEVVISGKIYDAETNEPLDNILLGYGCNDISYAPINSSTYNGTYAQTQTVRNFQPVTILCYVSDTNENYERYEKNVIDNEMVTEDRKITNDIYLQPLK